MKIVSSSGKGNFKIFVAEVEIVELKYHNWFSGKAEANYLNQTILLKPNNIWSYKIDIYKNDLHIGDLTFNFKGEIVIRIENQDRKALHYIVKKTSFWKHKFMVFNEDKVPQFAMTSTSNWSKMNYDYKIELAEFNKAVDLNELLLYCGYAANFYLASMNG